ncbi:hypothetical protein ABNB59_14670 [Paenibacillus larvae]|uniref:Uncharacterized protein n=3 Tax=root TaxID=1 RepID=A0A0K2CZ63_9CAUD|nr:hypothetical protein [Paenibacillus larvae]YP_009193889.1 hypothetical protein HARRISON_76 [Paenibacillus phage Harrison]ALA12636.1 hypothetical protein PAISLEY_76 [Paenibacillus phage Paisley]UYL93259.1 hypothetical protein CALLAN_69 [Paenibacillus phage Callan]UYL93336.1 hypothetical protein DASH_71 [Paenibacillus phage Dash]UYL93409.1 hypothetical protein LILO_63 [Paenibacillus phage Lilo]ALA12475.1 hypothetical protein HARRISON_76 [Paenibacillus phage Harrison]
MIRLVEDPELRDVLKVLKEQIHMMQNENESSKVLMYVTMLGKLRCIL